jgi:hypothetical protein
VSAGATVRQEPSRRADEIRRPTEIVVRTTGA